MTVHHKMLGLVTLAFLSCVPAARAVDDATIALLADGKAWTTTGPNGRKMTLTFHPDGTVRMKMGFLSRSMRWERSEEGVCLSGGPGGDRCLRLERSETGFVGHDGDAPPMTLTR